MAHSIVLSRPAYDVPPRRRVIEVRRASHVEALTTAVMAALATLLTLVPGDLLLT
jgi:hypothetical protein